MPEGVKQEDIDPSTGQIAKGDTVNKRSEFFINGSIPGSENADATDEAAQEPPTVSDGQETTKDPNIEPAALPESTPAEPPRAKPTPNARDLYDGASATKLQGTITLDIDPTTGLIAVDSCPVIRTRTFIIGQEPKKYCGH